MLQRSVRFSSTRPEFFNRFTQKFPTKAYAAHEKKSFEKKEGRSKAKGVHSFKVLYANIGLEFLHLNWASKIRKHALVLTSKNSSHKSKHVWHNFMIDGSIHLERIADKDLKILGDNIVATSLNDKSYIKDFHLAAVNRVRDDFAENNDMERLKVADFSVVELTNR